MDVELIMKVAGIGMIVAVVCQILGKDETLRRLRAGLSMLQA